VREKIGRFAGFCIIGFFLVGLAGAHTIDKSRRMLIRFPKYKPFFRNLIPMDGGRLAVVVDFEANDLIWLDIFDVGGRFLGRAKAPAQLMMFKNKKAYALHKDENGFLSIKRFAYEIQ
jgi:hypothetical protein